VGRTMRPHFFFFFFATSSSSYYYYSNYIVLFAGLREYCRWETFSASCPLDEVIVVRSALYGRMRSGRCLATAGDSGSHVGCKADVIRQADRLCSGRRTCDVQLPEPTFDVVQTSCPRGLSVYLEVIYECLPGKQYITCMFIR